TGLDYSRPLHTAVALGRLPLAARAARRLLREFAPDVVVGAAGYVCVPVVVAARTLGLPVVLMEQNAHPGRAVRRLARGARVVATSYAETAALLPGARVVHTGNPVRDQVLDALPAPLPERPRHLLVMGGSQGARRLNDAVAGALRGLLEGHPDLIVTHACGERDAPWAVPLRDALPEVVRERYVVAAFFDDVAARIAAADLVLMRAGGSSLAEVSVLGRPMLLVPYPHAGGHQMANALPYVRAGAARLIPDAELAASRLRREVEALLDDPAAWREMAAASRRCGRPDAAARVVELVEAVQR
ncbi:MAG TPA: UDP-N-acetylglucosamine--N-acetylmuramyl-(pentapeptide) pyrophosphoryl-undecaprenol N-acetylglucosamine transferase, partial [Candidatus Dormibacteraeota bacterium]